MYFNIYTYNLTTKDAISNYIFFLKDILKERHKIKLIANFNESKEEVVCGRRAFLEGFNIRKRIHWFHYSGYFPLIHLIKYVKGFKIFDYHSVTPKELWPYKTGKELIEKGAEFRNYVKYADLVILHSKSAYNELKPYLRKGQRYVIIRKYQLGKFHKEIIEKDKYKGIGLEKKDKIVLFVGRISPNKKVDILIKSLKYLSKNIKAVIIGKYDNEPYFSEYKKCINIAEKENVLERVLFLGQVSDGMLNDFYNLADVFVMPSIHEGFCIPIIEAMKCGTAVIGANSTALPETIGEAGLLFEPNNEMDLAKKINKILINDKLRNNLIKLGYKQCIKKQLKKDDIEKIVRIIK